jgi:ketopantoate reductase
MNITICGGGNLGHVCAGFLSAQSDNKVSLLTTKPEEWSKELDVIDCKRNFFHGVLDRISRHPDEVIPGAEMVLICLPGFAIGNELRVIAPYLHPSCLVGSVVSSTGFFFEAFKTLLKSQPLFGFQRVPFISRIIKYGKEAELKGYKNLLYVAIEQTNGKEVIKSKLENLFRTPMKLLDSHFEASLSNSNPLLHTSRLYTLWHDWKPGMSFDRNPDFYAEWTIEASELYINMDMEFQQILKGLGLRDGCIPSVLDYYESNDAESLTMKISSIPAFQGISSPMFINEFGKYEPDLTSRYFTEDFPYGLKFIVETANKQGINIPYINTVYNWGMRICQDNNLSKQ